MLSRNSERVLLFLLFLDYERADAVTKGLKLIENALGKKCHLDKPLKARMKYLVDNPASTMKTTLIVEMLMCASKFKAYDVSSPTMDIARCSYESILAGIISL
jgi:hypothetical protein